MTHPTMHKLLSALFSVAGLGVFAITPVLADELMPSSATDSPMATEAVADQLAQAGDTIVDIAAGNSAFSTLVTAVQAADLVDVLSGEGPFTVFAPTNDAFAALPTEVLDALLLPENQDLLTDVLTYHVVPDVVTSDDLVSPGEIETLNGPVRVRSSADEIIVNDANVVLADVEASNGVIHAIDTVLIPAGLVDALTARMAEAEMVEAPETPVVEEPVVAPAPMPAPATTAPAVSEPVQGLW